MLQRLEISEQTLIPLEEAIRHHAGPGRDAAWLASPESLFAFSIRDVPGLRASVAANTWFDALTAPDSPTVRALADEPAVRDNIAHLRRLVRAEVDPTGVPGLDPDIARALAILGGVRGGAVLWVEFPSGVDGETLWGAAAHTGGNTAALAAAPVAWIREHEPNPYDSVEWEGVSGLVWTRDGVASQSLALLARGEHLAGLAGSCEHVST